MYDLPITDLIIRKTSIEDIPLILKFIKGLAEFEHLGHMVTATEESLETAYFGQNIYIEARIAEFGGEPVGFIAFYHHFSNFIGKPGMYLEDIYVLPEYRGKGIGASLFLECVQIAKERDCGRMEWSALCWNPACEFYEGFGAELLKDWQIYRLDEKQMTKLFEKL